MSNNPSKEGTQDTRDEQSSKGQPLANIPFIRQDPVPNTTFSSPSNQEKTSPPSRSATVRDDNPPFQTPSAEKGRKEEAQAGTPGSREEGERGEASVKGETEAGRESGKKETYGGESEPTQGAVGKDKARGRQSEASKDAIAKGQNGGQIIQDDRTKMISKSTSRPEPSPSRSSAGKDKTHRGPQVFGHVQVKGNLVASRVQAYQDRVEAAKEQEDRSAIRPRPRTTVSGPQLSSSPNRGKSPGGNKTDQNDITVSNMNVCPHGRIRPDPKRLASHHAFVGHKQHDLSDPNGPWALAARHFEEADTEYGQSVCQICLTEARDAFKAPAAHDAPSPASTPLLTPASTPVQSASRVVDPTVSSPTLVQSTSAPVTPRATADPPHARAAGLPDPSSNNASKTVVPGKDGDVVQRSQRRISISTPFVGSETVVNDAVADLEAQVLDMPIGSADLALLTEALDSIITEHGCNLRSIAERLSKELEALQGPKTPVDNDGVPGNCEGGSFLDGNRKKKLVTFATLPVPLRPENLESLSRKLCSASKEIAYLIAEIEQEITSWSRMLSEWDGGRGDVLGDIAMQEQEKRAQNVGLWLPRGVPRPLRARTYSTPTEQLGLAEQAGNDGDKPPGLERRGTVWFESEEFIDAREGI